MMSGEKSAHLKLLDTVASMTSHEILDFRLADAAQERAIYLTERNKAGILSTVEAAELEEMLELDLMVSALLAKALKTLKQSE